MSTIINNLCNCCNDCLRRAIHGCPTSVEFNAEGLPDQTVNIYIQNLATNRVIMLTSDSVDGIIEVDLSEINLASDMNYKLILRDASGQVIDFTEDVEDFNCFEFRIISNYE